MGKSLRAPRDEGFWKSAARKIRKGLGSLWRAFLEYAKSVEH